MRIRVPIQTYSSPKFLITKYVKRAEAEILTRLLPIRITPRTLSIFSRKTLMRFADFWPFSAALSSLIWLIAIIEVSEPEKKAETIMSSINTPIRANPISSICVKVKINQKNKK